VIRLGSYQRRRPMRSIDEALREREIQVHKLRGEIEKLREAARILEESERGSSAPVPAAVPMAVPPKRWP
jgi:hypothetical protein